jgi:hypothetical protein
MVRARMLSPRNELVDFDISKVKIVTPVDSRTMRVIFKGGKQCLIDTIINE